MPRYLFQLMDGSGSDVTEVEHEFRDLDAARREARSALSEMAKDGLPDDRSSMLSVEVLSEDRVPLLEIRLLLEEIPKGK